MGIPQIDCREKTVVFYDGDCPLCSSEIQLYKKNTKPGSVQFIDVALPSVNLPDNLNRKTALSRFHVMNRNGELLSGALAFSELWKQMPRWSWIGYIASRPFISGVLEVGYNLFLKFRPLLVQIYKRFRSTGIQRHNERTQA